VDTCWAEATSCRSGIGQSDKTAQAQKTPYVWKISLPLMHELMSTNVSEHETCREIAAKSAEAVSVSRA